MNLFTEGLRRLAAALWLLSALAASVNAQDNNLTNLWDLEVGSLVHSSPAVADDGTIYFGTFRGKLFAVNPDGTPKWIYQAGREIFSSPAVGDDGTIYFGSRDRNLYALAPAGKKKWAFRTGLWVDSSPGLGIDGTIYFGSWDGHFYALAPDGSKRWDFNTGGPVTSSPAVTREGTILFGSHDGKLYALKPDGSQAWAFPTGGAVISSPAVGANGVIYFTSVDGFLCALNADGTLKWRLRTGGTTESSPTLAGDGNIYLGVNSEIVIISPAGQRGVSWKNDGDVRSTPLAFATNAFCYSTSWGYFMYMGTNMAGIRWTFLRDYGNSSAGISSAGIVYTPGLHTKFCAFPGLAPLAKSRWPKFRADARNTGRAPSVTD